MTSLFVYGTLRHPPLRAALLGRAVAGRPAVLDGHRVAPLRGRAYPGLVREPGTAAVGEVLALDDADIAVLDDFEGDQYTRIAVRPTVGGTSVDAEVYLVTGEPTLAVVGPGTWSFDGFVVAHAAEWVGAATPGDHHPR